MADSKRRILLIALGTTPHLLTLTLAALYKESPEAMPTEIRIVTTELGAEMARRSFFGEGNILDAFWRDYGLSPAAFTEADIHAISSADGEPIADIRTLDDSNRAADLIVKLVRECCEDPDASLHVSIVGGRKSMGMLMGSAPSTGATATASATRFPKTRRLPTAGPIRLPRNSPPIRTS